MPEDLAVFQRFICLPHGYASGRLGQIILPFQIDFPLVCLADGYARCLGRITLPFPIDFPFVSLPDASAALAGSFCDFIVRVIHHN